MKRLISFSLAGTVLAVMVLPVLLFVTPSPKAYADVPGTQTDANHITVQGVTYTNCNVTATTSAYDCFDTGQVDFFPLSNWVAPTYGQQISGVYPQFCSASNFSSMVGKSFILTPDNKTYYLDTIQNQPNQNNCFSETKIALTVVSTGIPTLHGTFINRSVIQLSDGTVYTDGKLDNNFAYYNPGNSAGSGSSCANNVITSFTNNMGSAKLYAVKLISSSGNCTQLPTALADVSLNTVNAQADFAWSSTTTVNRSDSTGSTFTRADVNSKTLTISEQGCIFTLNVADPNSSHSTTGTISEAPDPSGKGCTETNPFPSGTVHIAAFNSAAGISNNGATKGSSTAAGSPLDCNWDPNPLTWIVCPLMDGMKLFIQTVDDYITGALTFDSNQVFHTQTGYYKAWNSFRVLAIGLLVIAGLVMVASQALGFEFLDAYTIRKVLPRLIIAVIGITLSWPLMEFLVNFINTLGVDVRQLIESPFETNLSGSFGGSTLLVANVGVLLTGLALGIIGALSFGLTAVLALIVGFAIIVARDLGLIVIIILAPIAIASYILPNTQKVWKIWFDNLLGLLLVFPIIEAFIAIGRVFSAVSLSGTGTTATGAGTVAQVIGFAAYFAPYFLLPVAFRLATGFIGTVAGFMNDRGRGVFDRLKKYRGNTMQKNWQRTKAGNRFEGDNALSRRASHALQTGTLIPAGRMTLSASKRRARMQAVRRSHEHDAASEFIKESAAFNAFSGDDDVLKAAINGENEADIKARLRAIGGRFTGPGGEDTVNVTAAEIMRAKRETSEEVFKKAAVRALAPTGTAFDDNGQMLAAINQAYGDDRSGAGRALAEMRSASMQAGRVDLGAGSYGTMARQLQTLHQIQKTNGTLTAADLQRADGIVMDSVAESSAAGQAVYGKEISASHIALTHRRNIEEIINGKTDVNGNFVMGINQAAAAGDTARVEQLQRDLKLKLADVAGIHDAMSTASPQNAKAYADQIMGAGLLMTNMNPAARAAIATVGNVSSTASSFTIKEAIDNLAARDQTFIERRRDYGTGRDYEQAQRRPTPGAGGPPPAPGGGPPGVI